MKQRSKEWYEFRRNHIGSSDAYIIWEGNPTKLYQLWEIKRGVKEDSPPSIAMQHGIDLEEEALGAYCAFKGDTYMPGVLEHPTNKFISASMDGISILDNSIVEIKCPYTRKYEDLQGDNWINMQHMIQMQHQMYVAGVGEVDYFIYFGPSDFRVKTVYRDDKIIDELIAKEVAFLDMVISNTPPLKQMEGLEWHFAVSEYKRALKNEKEAVAQREEAGEQLKKLAGEIPCMGDGITLTQVTREGSIDYKAIPELKDVDLEKYRKQQTTYWKINVKREDEQM